MSVNNIYNNILKGAIILITAFIYSCGGSSEEDDIADVDPNTLYLSDLSVEGHDIEFDRLKFGTYEINVDSEVSTVQISADAEKENIELRFEHRSEEGLDTTIADESGTFNVELSEGTNVVSVQLWENGEQSSSSYVVEIYKLRSSASILSYTLFDFNASGSPAIATVPTFVSSTFDYTASVRYGACAYALSIVPNETETLTFIEGEEIDVDFLEYVSLDVGDNFIETTVTSEDQSLSERYAFLIERASPTAEQVQSDATLQSLEFANEDLEFVCGINQYTLVIDNDVNVLDFVATTTIDGAAVYLDERRIDEGNTVSVPIDDDIGTLNLSVTALDGVTTESYQVNYLRRSRRIVEVDSAQSLQTALRIATPNDEIRLLPGVYEGIASTDASGDANAHFFSDRSGTVNEPIVLTVDDTNEDTILHTEESGNSVLKITGQHWEIRNIEITGGNIGLELNSANFIEVRDIEVSESLSHGAVVQNNSNNNTIALSSFHDIGNTETDLTRAAILVGVDESESQSAPANTTGLDERAHENMIRQNDFYRLGDATAIKIEEGATSTLVEYNHISEEFQRSDAQRESLIAIQGNDTTFRYNTFLYEINQPIESIISISPAEESWHDMNWGENSIVYQNTLDLDERDILGLDAKNGVVVSVTENFRSDTEDDDEDADPIEITYNGSGVQTNGLTVPIYQIQIANDDRKCLGLEASEDNDELFLVTVKSCTDDISMQWKLIADESPFVVIKNEREEDGFMRTVQGFQSLCNVGEQASSFVFLDEDTQGFNQRWLIDHDGDGEVFLRSKKERAFGLTIPGNTFANDQPLLTCAVTGSDQQRFRLVQVN